MWWRWTKVAGICLKCVHMFYMLLRCSVQWDAIFWVYLVVLMEKNCTNTARNLCYAYVVPWHYNCTETNSCSQSKCYSRTDCNSLFPSWILRDFKCNSPSMLYLHLYFLWNTTCKLVSNLNNINLIHNIWNSSAGSI